MAKLHVATVMKSTGKLQDYGGVFDTIQEALDDITVFASTYAQNIRYEKQDEDGKYLFSYDMNTATGGLRSTTRIYYITEESLVSKDVSPEA